MHFSFTRNYETKNSLIWQQKNCTAAKLAIFFIEYKRFFDTFLIFNTKFKRYGLISLYIYISILHCTFSFTYIMYIVHAYT